MDWELDTRKGGSGEEWYIRQSGVPHILTRGWEGLGQVLWGHRDSVVAAMHSGARVGVGGRGLVEAGHHGAVSLPGWVLWDLKEDCAIE